MIAYKDMTTLEHLATLCGMAEQAGVQSGVVAELQELIRSKLIDNEFEITKLSGSQPHG